jgi:hypothetical protein
MSLKDCIDEAVGAGEMDGKRGRAAKDLFDEIEAELREQLGPEAASSTAARETIARMEAELNESARQKLLSAVTQKRIMRDLETYRTAGGLENMNQAASGLVDGVGLAVKSVSAEQIRKVVRGRAHGMMDEALSTFRRNMIGQTRNKAKLVNLVREAFGEKTGDVAANELMLGWRKSAEFLRREFNNAGGHIGWREDWGLPQSHDNVAVRRASYEGWRDFILPKLDPGRMIDGATGKAFTPGRLETALRDVYETIRTDGLSKVAPGSAGGQGRSLGNRRADHRFLAFKSADDWLAYQERFGTSDPFSTMMGHIDGMARDIGAMRALGPNPNTSIRFIQTMLKREARKSGDDAAVNAADRSAYFLESLYGQYAGTFNSPVDSRIGGWIANLRQFLVSAQLGSAAISALGDVAFQRLTSRFVGIPDARIVGRIATLLKPGNEADRKLAVRMGLIAEDWAHHASAQARYTGEAVTGEIASRLSDFVLRASGLSPWTQAGRWAFGMEFMGALADHAGVEFKALNPALQKTFQRYGIGEDAWNIIRATELVDHKGAAFFIPENLAARGGKDLTPAVAEDLTTRVLAMVQSETEYAVPSTSLTGAAFFKDRTRAGTLPGEIIRSGLMYKNFGLTLMHLHLRRMAEQQGAFNKAGYGARLVIGATLMGALAVQLKDIAKGRDPRKMDNLAFWGAALLQGGGLGIFGDFLQAETNRSGGGLAETVAGPVGGVIWDAGLLTIGNATEAANGKDMHAGREAVKFLQRYSPGASLWYARLTAERLIFDQLRLLLDPDARVQMRAQQRRAQREYGQDFFWQPGDVAPDRAPDLSNAIGDRR